MRPRLEVVKNINPPWRYYFYFYTRYDNLLPRMNQIVVSSQTHPIIDSVKSILYTACSEPVFNQAKTQNRSQKAYLEELGFSALGDPVFGAGKTNVAKNAKLASELVELIIA